MRERGRERERERDRRSGPKLDGRTASLTGLVVPEVPETLISRLRASVVHDASMIHVFGGGWSLTVEFGDFNRPGTCHPCAALIRLSVIRVSYTREGEAQHLHVSTYRQLPPYLLVSTSPRLLFSSRLLARLRHLSPQPAESGPSQLPRSPPRSRRVQLGLPVARVASRRIASHRIASHSSHAPRGTHGLLANLPTYGWIPRQSPLQPAGPSRSVLSTSCSRRTICLDPWPRRTSPVPTPALPHRI